ncbi:hypothetical protein N8342_05585 [Acidimicrobiales bacterium]|nr:hypothetical protein [bacterium]MDC1389298.1 hypothetical protein [Acidimicrobiales bacterium]
MQRLPSTGSDLITAIAAALTVGAVAAFAATGLTFSDAADVAVHPATMAFLLGLITIPLIRWAVRGDHVLFRIVLGGMVAKCLGTYLRFAITADTGDNRRYDSAGTKIAGWLSDDFVLPQNLPESFGDTGTDWLSYMVGWLYYFTGPNRVSACVVFTFLSFVGTLFFYRAAASAVPELDRRRYALLLFYLPSLLFWPSSIGKEAWMIFFLGLAALGGSLVVQHHLSVWHLGAALAGIAMAARIRPHMAALMVVALVAASIWPSRSQGRRGQQIIVTALGFALISVAMGQVAEYFKADRVEFNTLLDFTQERTAGGGSQFTPIRITGPGNLVQGAVSVIFRPFLIEATNLLQLLGSIESLAMTALAARSWKRIRRVPRLFLTNAYVRFSVIFTMGFVVAFSAISNFGILTRQRAQLWPILLVLFALAPATDAGPGRQARNANTAGGTDDTADAVPASVIT